MTASNSLPNPGAAISQSSDFRRLSILLRLADGAWALAVYEDAEVQRLLIERLRETLAAQAVYAISLAAPPIDIPAKLQGLSDAAVVCFTSLDGGIRDGTLPAALDLQRDVLAQQSQRLVFWLRETELRVLAQQAPNFYSRISGIFSFPGKIAGVNTAPAIEPRASTESHTPPTGPSYPRRRPRVAAKDNQAREQQILRFERRLEALRGERRPDEGAIGDSWYDLAGLYDADILPYRREEAEAAYVAAARAYASANATTAEAEAWLLAGQVAFRIYAHDAALHHLSIAERLYSLLGDGQQQGIARTYEAIGDVQQYRDERDAALASYDQALKLYRAVGDRLGEANVLLAIGDVQQFRDERDAALASYDQALKLFRAVDDRLGEANVLRAIGDVQQFRGERDAALASYDQALKLYRAVGDRLGEANVLRAIGDVQQFRGERDAALASYDQALKLYRAVGAKVGEANVLLAIGNVQRFRDERDAALVSYDQALKLFRAVGVKVGEANVLAAQSRLFLEAEPQRSISLQKQALALRHAIDDVYGEATDLYNYALGLKRYRRFSEAIDTFTRARDVYASRGLERNATNAASQIAELQAQAEVKEPSTE